MSHEAYSDDELLDWVQALSENGEPPTSAEMDNSEGPSYTTYFRRFGSWNRAVKAAGFEPRASVSIKEYTEQGLLDWAREVADDGALTRSEMLKSDGPHPETYTERFGSWHDAVEAAGLDRPTEITTLAHTLRATDPEEVFGDG